MFTRIFPSLVGAVIAATVLIPSTSFAEAIITQLSTNDNSWYQARLKTNEFGIGQNSPNLNNPWKLVVLGAGLTQPCYPQGSSTMPFKYDDVRVGFPY